MIQTIAISGVGLIGGSFGLALKAAGFTGEIVGVSSPRTIAAAWERGAIDRGASLEEAAAQADLLYLAQPIGRILDQIRHLDPLLKEGALVTDAGSTKHAIVKQAERSIHRARFIGGHPMAGKETRGVESADANLFRGRTYVLTPRVASDVPQEFLDLLASIGARVVVVTPEEHDRVVSFTSHLPQLLSTALAATVAENVEENLEVAGPGLIDSTRLALSAYDLWRDILATNEEEVARAITAMQVKLDHLRDNLKTRELQKEFEIAANLAARLRQRPDAG